MDIVPLGEIKGLCRQEGLLSEINGSESKRISPQLCTSRVTKVRVGVWNRCRRHPRTYTLPSADTSYFFFPFFLPLKLNKTSIPLAEKKNAWPLPPAEHAERWLEPESDFSPWQDQFIPLRIGSTPPQGRGEKIALSVFPSR